MTNKKKVRLPLGIKVGDLVVADLFNGDQAFGTFQGCGMVEDQIFMELRNGQCVWLCEVDPTLGVRIVN